MPLYINQWHNPTNGSADSEDVLFIIISIIIVIHIFLVILCNIIYYNNWFNTLSVFS